MKTILILPDGSEISSGAVGAAAVLSCKLTVSVNTGQELDPGACCAAMAELSILEPTPKIQAGDEIQLLRTDGETVKTVGLFTAQRPTVTNGVTKLTAYDRVAWLDQDMSAWLDSLSWPCTLLSFAQQVCACCGLELTNTEIPNGELSIERFSAAGVTGRQLMQWVGQACGRFLRATPSGTVELSWYAPKDIAITAGGQHFYYQNSLSMEGYTVAPVEKVQLAQTVSDVGVVWPNVTGKANTLVIRGNPLLAARVTEQTEPVAQALYEQFSAISYTPCRVTVDESCGITAGDIVTVADKTVYVMTARLQSGRLTLECTGSADRNDTAAVNQLSYKALSGRVLELDTRIEGLTAENRDGAGKLSRLSLTVEGIAAQVSTGQSQTDQRLTRLEQDGESLKLRVEQGTDQVTTVTGYTFGADGLKIAKSGTEMENRVDHTGMYVARSGEVILQAGSTGVTATDVQVHNYLNVGKHARFEDYADRTACFYIS